MPLLKTCLLVLGLAILLLNYHLLKTKDELKKISDRVDEITNVKKNGVCDMSEFYVR